MAFYGPTDQKATKVVVGIVQREHADPDKMRKWFSEEDIREEPGIQEEILGFIRANSVKSVVMVDRIFGCPHEEGIDYPEGQSCPLCFFWVARNRFTGRVEH